MTQTIGALTSIIGEAETTYERGNAEVDRAIERFATEKAKLFRADGSAVYADAVYQEKLEALTAELHATAGRVYNQAEAQIGVVNRLVEAEHTDPIGALSLDEQRQASGRATFVREDAMLEKLPDLVRRLRGVSAAGKNKVDAYLWSRYARQRIASEQEKRDAGGLMTDVDRRHLADLRDAITDLEAVVIPNPALTKSQATQRITDARRFQQALRTRIRDVDGSKEALMAQMRAQHGYF